MYLKTREIPIAQIFQGEQLVRDCPEDDSIGELAESIEKNGLLQPIGVNEWKDGQYQLLWGDRRVKAYLRLGKHRIRATIYTDEVDSVKGLALVENIQRQQLTLAEEVQAVTYMIEDNGLSIERVAAAVSKSRSWVLNRIMVPNLPQYLREPLLAGDLPISHVEIISQVADNGAREYLTAMCLQNRWNKSQLKIIADCYTTGAIQPQPSADPPRGVNPNPPQNPWLYTCEICGEKGQLHQFDLVRVHKDGHGCRTAADRSDPASARVDGLESNQHGPSDGGNEDHGGKT